MTTSTILVVAEHAGGALRDVSLELISAAISLGGDVIVALVGNGIDSLTSGVNVEGVKEIIIHDTVNSGPTCTDYADALVSIAAERKPSIMIGAHNAEGMGWGGALAAVMNAGFASGVTAVAREAAGLVCQREIFGGKLVAEMEFMDAELVVLLLTEGTFAPAIGLGRATVSRIGALDARTIDRGYSEASFGEASIEQAEFILSIGRGVRDQADVARFAAVATALGGTLASSRPLVDSGWLPAAKLVGQSGRTVKPKVYLAFGISGAAQHLAGMRKSAVVIAINKDADAPIYRHANYGSTGDLHDVLEALEYELGLG